MKNVLAGKKVLVTGGTGSIGSEIVRQALAQDAGKVIVFNRDSIKQFLLKARIPDERLTTIVGDVRSQRSLEQVFTRLNIDIIYHAAAMKHVVMCEDFALEAVETNIVGTQNVVDLAIKYDIPKMISISTDKAAYPVNVMGATKFIAERITLNGNNICKNNQTFSCVRFGNVAGSRGSVIPVFIENLLHKTPLLITDPGVTRFIMEIPDAVRLIMKATGYARGGEIFILKMKAFRLGDLLDITLNEAAPIIDITKEDIEINMKGLIAGEKLHEDMINDIEATRLYELDDMYVILRDNEEHARYPAIRKANLDKYASSDVELISTEELKAMVMKYLKKHMISK
jgi:UDP-N-acetylglucosamine 4,6-dehydratase